MPQYSVPSSEELDNSSTRNPLPGKEDYRATILEITPVTKLDFNQKMANLWTVKFVITAFADGAPLQDIKEESVQDRWCWKDIDPQRTGFKSDGMPSVSREFLLTANGIDDMDARIPDGDSDELIGREIILSLVVYKSTKDGKQKNKIAGFKAATRRRGRGANTTPTTPSEETVRTTREKMTLDPEYVRQVASLKFDTDEPTPEQLADIVSSLSA